MNACSPETRANRARASSRGYTPHPPMIEDDVSIGAGAGILPGVRLGRGCLVGAGAVVTRDVEPYQTVVGNPARPLRVTAALEAR